MTTTLPRALKVGDPRHLYRNQFCSGKWGVSCSFDGCAATATPHRFVRDTVRNGNPSMLMFDGDLGGKQFKNSDEAFAAMHAHGYGEPYVTAWCPSCRKLHRRSDTFKFVPTRDGRVIDGRDGFCTVTRTSVNDLWREIAKLQPRLP